MAGDGKYRHIFLPDIARTSGFTNPRRGGSPPRIPVRNRKDHSAYLKKQLEKAWAEAEKYKRLAVSFRERQGAYIEFIGEPEYELVIKSLEKLNSGIRLLNVRKIEENNTIRAIVYIPFNKRALFLKTIQDYAEKNTKLNKPKNKLLIDSISDIQYAVFESFFKPQEKSLIPDKQPAWIEVWLSSDEESVIQRFNDLIKELEIKSSQSVLKFPERTVRLIHANRESLEKILMLSDDIAEFCVAKEVATFFLEQNNKEQAQWVEELLGRTSFNKTEISVCVLDTGINNGHKLIAPVLDSADMQAVIPAWNTNDHDGHGTLMAGTAAYGDLLELLNSNDKIQISHCLESVKILPPPPGKNKMELWGDMTIQGVSFARIKAPDRKRIICMAITATDNRDRGHPTSWSAAIDETTSGYLDDNKKMFIISAGNTGGSVNWVNYPDDNKTNEIHDPGQSWNALTVGSYTEKVKITDTAMSGFSPIAPAGGLSPFSTTSAMWSSNKWPIKPDVVFEGGNAAKGPNNSAMMHEDLQLISTYFDPTIAQFGSFGQTSASSALASFMAAKIQVMYPDAWPETVRALIVHNAEWTDTMKSQFITNPKPTKQDYIKLLRICGYGVPNLERSLYCASNSLTLIAQSELQPFDKRNGRYVTRDMHVYDLPWPIEELNALGEVNVKMRVTLSYFIEPGPGEVGWGDRYRYASHGLRFAVNGPGESMEEFEKRVNEQARDDDSEYERTGGPGDWWLIGEARNVGSIHSDIWEGNASELAASNKIAIYPATGWWKERDHLKKWNKSCRYSLIVSIHTPDVSTDIYIPVTQKIKTMIPIEVKTRRIFRTKS
jgi:hypothetical protein